MAEAAIPRAVLAHLVPYRGDGIAITPLDDRTRCVLRGTPDAAFCAAMADLLGVAPPLQPNTAALAESVCVLWLGPDEWLVEGEAVQPARLAAATAGFHAAVVDVTHVYAAIRLAGPRAPDILASGCSLDLHPRIFPGVARTLLGKATVLLHRIEDAAVTTFDLYVPRSYADYLWRWLRVAASE